MFRTSALHPKSANDRSLAICDGPGMFGDTVAEFAGRAATWAKTLLRALAGHFAKVDCILDLTAVQRDKAVIGTMVATIG